MRPKVVACVTGVLLIALLVFGILTVSEASPSPAEANVARIDVVPMAGTSSAGTTIYGAGFAPGEEVRLLLAVEDLTIQLAAKEAAGIVKANKFGTFKLSSGFPLGVEPGIYTLKAVGNKGSTAVAPMEFLKK